MISHIWMFGVACSTLRSRRVFVLQKFKCPECLNAKVPWVSAEPGFWGLEGRKQGKPSSPNVPKAENVIQLQPELEQSHAAVEQRR